MQVTLVAAVPSCSGYQPHAIDATQRAMVSIKQRTLVTGIGIGFLMLMVLPFALYAARSGVSGLFTPGIEDSRFFVAGRMIGNHAIFGHMLLGGVLTLLIPLQLWGALRHRFPALHRWSGRLLITFAVITGLGGLLYIALRGTIGGFWMDAGFTLYGVLLVLSATQAIRFARAGRYGAHRRWALRLFVLAMGSWLYRVHYGIWYALTGGVASTPTFEGTFDLVQNVAFYLPYLLLLEVWLRKSAPR